MNLSVLCDIASIAGVASLGLVLGSFAGALSHRIPRDLSWGRLRGQAKRSHCPVCHTCLRWKDLIPLVSWLTLRGRCRYCAEDIGTRYIKLEIASLVLSLALYASYGLSSGFFLSLASVPFLLTLSVTGGDMPGGRLPLQLFVYPGLFGALYQHDIVIKSGAAGLLPTAIEGGAVFAYVIAMLSYVAACLFGGWLYQASRSPHSPDPGLATFGVMSGLWHDIHAVPVFFLVMITTCCVAIVANKRFGRELSKDHNIIWVAVVVAFYTALIAGHNFTGAKGLLAS